MLSAAILVLGLCLIPLVIWALGDRDADMPAMNDPAYWEPWPTEHLEQQLARQVPDPPLTEDGEDGEGGYMTVRRAIEIALRNRRLRDRHAVTETRLAAYLTGRDTTDSDHEIILKDQEHDRT